MSTPTGTLRDWVTALRPRQWTKNAAVLAALLFSRHLFDREDLLAALATLAAFCFLGSATYLVNDVFDREKDRLHPEKSQRPIAAGRVPAKGAVLLAVLLAAGGLALCFAVNVPTGITGVAYLVLQAFYTTILKSLVLLDVFAISAGFVLRVYAGAEAIDVPVSTWLYLCTLLLALLLALAKRRHELVLLDLAAANHRGALAQYSVQLVDQLSTIVTACLLLAYALYTVDADTVAKFGTDRLKFTIPLVLYGVFRYIFLVHRRGLGGSPEKVLLGDGPILLTCAGWGAMVAFILY